MLNYFPFIFFASSHPSRSRSQTYPRHRITKSQTTPSKSDFQWPLPCHSIQDDRKNVTLTWIVASFPVPHWAKYSCGNKLNDVSQLENLVQTMCFSLLNFNSNAALLLLMRLADVHTHFHYSLHLIFFKHSETIFRKLDSFTSFCCRSSSFMRISLASARAARLAASLASACKMQ